MRTLVEARWLRGAACVLVLGVFGTVASGQSVAVTAQVEFTGRKLDKQSAPDASNVVVWLTPAAPERQTAAASSSRALPRLVQQNKAFSPHVLVVQMGELVQFPNKDRFLHNVFSLYDGKRFDLGFYEAGSSKSVRFDRPGVSFLFCNIHPEMSAAVVVVDTPYFALSGPNGRIEIPAVPEGKYNLHVWSEQGMPAELKALERQLTITTSAHDLGTIRVKVNPEFTVEHKNKYGQDYVPPSSTDYARP
jgi:plastocyanin